MLDRPPLTDDLISATLRDSYGIETEALEFLASGQDADAWTFGGRGHARGDVFVKIRRGIDPRRLAAVRWLRDSGIEEVVAPVPTIGGDLFVWIDGLPLTVYPFVEGREAAAIGLTDEQWRAYGAVVGRLHGAVLPPETRATLPIEDFLPKFLVRLGPVQTAVDALLEREADPARDRNLYVLAEGWHSHQADTEAVARRAKRLGAQLRERMVAGAVSPTAFVPCHGDVHTHNLLVDAGGSLHVVDWDDLVIAPPERDLMFVLGSPIGLAPGEREARLFLDGYGPVDVDPVRLAYYHAEWALQDVVGYAERVLSSDVGPESRAVALRIFLGLFDPDGEVEIALRADDAPGS